ncbi:MAG: HAMP domain-containing sensor histidine kinase [Candidatus Nitrosotenuis sp.]
MKIISKTYLLIGVLIAVAIFNLGVLYNTQITSTAESYSIIRAGDLKAKVETIANLATSIAGGKEPDRDVMRNEILVFDNILETLRNGGTIRGQNTLPIPDEIISDYEKVRKNWDEYRLEASKIQTLSTYDSEVVTALNYVLGKNSELILGTNSLVRDLEELDRNYNEHKAIAAQLYETAKTIEQNALLISIGGESDVRDDIRKARLSFDIGIRTLLGTPLDDLGLEGEAKTLAPIPRASSKSLDEVDVLWESVRLRVKVLETKPLRSDEFIQSFASLNVKRESLVNAIDDFLDKWNESRIDRRTQGELLTQAVIGINIGIFFVVLIIIRKSLMPLNIIIKALARVKEGIYGEKIEYAAQDEIGDLASSFNTMSETVRLKEEEARKTGVAKDEFLAMITHELKTPLVPIQGYADILLSGHLGSLTDKQRERVSVIKSSAVSLLQLISDLLDVQKIELGQLKMKKTLSHIHPTVEKAIQIFEPQIDEYKIKVENKVDKKTLVPHDVERIVQVLTNLIKNSLKAIKPQTGVITIHSSEDQDEVKIFVTDNGMGIPPEKQANLFTKFYQVDASLTREKGGSGLGLSICRGIIETHGGRIMLESAPSGTTVIFSLPKHDKTPIASH